MDLITITRPVTVKVRVTDAYKKAAAAELQDTLARLDARLAQLNFQYKKVEESEKKAPRQETGGLGQIEAERRKIAEARTRINERLKEIGRLAEGQEVLHGRVESLVNVKIGDHWEGLMSVEVVVQDGLVVEIRQKGIS